MLTGVLLKKKLFFSHGSDMFGVPFFGTTMLNDWYIICISLCVMLIRWACVNFFCVQLHNSTLLKQTANILLVWINKLIAYFITVVGNRNIWLSKQHYAAKNHAGVVTLCIFCVERLVCRVHNRLVCRVHLHNFVAVLEFKGYWQPVWSFYVYSLYVGALRKQLDIKVELSFQIVS